ncbi:MAG: hypothetical protein DSY89_09685 [Deltaproteobacteria bacterium]|nr:MAG: hypothetical protein DSY89_09685 [Deltaproteobacteria bacterium]
MKKQTPNPDDPCNNQALSRFLDGDLTRAEQSRVERHLADCKDCRKTLNRMNLLSGTCQSVFAESRFHKELAGLEGRILSRARRPASWREAAWRFFREKKVFIPVSAAGTIMAVFVTFQIFFTSPATPSAIITSITGDLSSVMIMETPESHQTIIWIKEKT